MCMPFWLGGAAGGPFWYEGKGVCVCLFGLLVQLVGLFGTEAMACAFLAGWCSRWAFLARRQGRVCMPFWPVGAAGGPFWHGGNGVCVGLVGMEARARVCAFLACWRVCVPFWLVGAACWWALLAWRQGRVCVPFWLVGARVCLFGLLEQLITRRLVMSTLVRSLDLLNRPPSLLSCSRRVLLSHIYCLRSVCAPVQLLCSCF